MFATFQPSSVVETPEDVTEGDKDTDKASGVLQDTSHFAKLFGMASGPVKNLE